MKIAANSKSARKAANNQAASNASDPSTGARPVVLVRGPA